MRKQMHLSKEYVSKYLGVTTETLVMLEKGEQALTSDMLDKLEALFGVQLSYFEELATVAKTFSVVKLSYKDLEAVSAINRIALNCNFMARLLEAKTVLKKGD